MSLQALIFDLDGTLIDSTPAYAAAAHQAFQEFSLPYTEAEFHNLAIGVPLKVWLQEKGVDEETIPKIAARRDALVLDALTTETEWREGAQDALQRLSKHFPLAIVTGAWTSSVDAIDERLDLRRFTSVIVDGDAVKPRFKPDPYGLHLAADQLRVEPSAAAYIGDQLFDMLAARNAGMQSILIPGPHTTLTDELKGATDRHLQDWRELAASFIPMSDFTLATERLRLRRLSRDDAPYVLTASQTPGFTDGMTWGPMETIDETHIFTDHALELWEKREKFVWTIETKDDGTFVGRIEVGRVPEQPGNVWELGYWIYPAQQGKGYATEAAREALRFAFEDLRVESVLSSHHDWNEASGKVLTKIGMKHTGFSEARTEKKGKPVRAAEFWLDRKDWTK